MGNVQLISTKNFTEVLRDYVSHSCFNDARLIPQNPYQRPLRRKDLVDHDFTIPITYNEIVTNKNLLIHRILNTIYEQDLLLLDDSFNTEQGYTDFQAFYDPEFVALGKSIKPVLEYTAFSFLKKEIEVIGNWTKEKFNCYVSRLITEYESEPSMLCEVIRNSVQPVLAAKNMLIQMAPDFLTEASAMGRALLGSFGVEQSEMMKVFIDEYGYGVHDTKHSTLFEKTLHSVGLSHKIHTYYNDYLPTSLMLGNYFHYLCSNRANHFQHLGALFYSEAVIPHFNRQISKTLKSIISGIDTAYFDEHVHIDSHHQRMVLDKMILSGIDHYGEDIIDEILLGIESQKMLMALADADLIAQIHFMNQLYKQEQITLSNFNKIGNLRPFDEIKDELTSGHLHNETELFTVNQGSLTFYYSPLAPITLTAGESIIIPKGRLHSTVIQSDKINYTVQSVVKNQLEVAA